MNVVNVLFEAFQYDVCMYLCIYTYICTVFIIMHVTFLYISTLLVFICVLLLIRQITQTGTVCVQASFIFLLDFLIIVWDIQTG
jgi:hypothetical protein